MKPIIIAFLFPLAFSCKSSKESVQNSNTVGDPMIAFNVAVKDSNAKSNYEVFTMNMDGSGSKNITNNPDVAWTYMSYKKDLYWISDRDTCFRCYFLYKSDINGNNIKKVSDLQLEDSWMDTRNNGTEIIVSGRKGKLIRHQLFIIQSSTGAFHQITNDTTAYFRDPAFSPDGKQIACVYKKNKNDTSIKDEIFLLDQTGTVIKQLTTYREDSLSRNGYQAGALRWHPTENFISYISMQKGQHNIYAVTPDGSRQWKLTTNDYSEGWHDWSDDGMWLVFDRAYNNESQYHIMLMNWKTKEVKQLTDSTYKYHQSPVFVNR